jgi:hypothetical protein
MTTPRSLQETQLIAEKITFRELAKTDFLHSSGASTELLAKPQGFCRTKIG